jgi:transposase
MERGGEILANGSRGNSAEEVAAVVTRLNPQARVEAAIESCSGAANLAEELVVQAGWSVSLAHPGYVSRMKQTPDKTDWQDSRVLADLVRVGYLPRVWLAPREIRELRKLVRFRQQLAAQRRAVKQRIRALLRVSAMGSSWRGSAARVPATPRAAPGRPTRD